MVDVVGMLKGSTYEFNHAWWTFDSIDRLPLWSHFLNYYKYLKKNYRLLLYLYFLNYYKYFEKRNYRLDMMKYKRKVITTPLNKIINHPKVIALMFL